MLNALLRRRLAEVSGLPQAELAALLPAARAATPRREAPTVTGRSSPSLLRGLMKCVLLEPELIRKIVVPRPEDAGLEGDALTALAEFCAATRGPLTTQGIMQHFADSPHEAVLLGALAAGESEGLSAESLEIQLSEGVQRYWMVQHRRGASAAERPGVPGLPPEEAERARQRDLVRERLRPRR
jgi:hypothetical protein